MTPRALPAPTEAEAITICAIPGCGRPQVARRLCNAHYKREQAAGRLGQWPVTRRRAPLCACGCAGRPARYGAEYIVGHRPRTEPAPRFWEKVDKSTEPGGCWLWTGAIGSHGYGTFWTGQQFVLAHRFSLVLAGCTVPDDLTVDHLCRSRACVNPAHLDVVTLGENIRRAQPFRHNITHCTHGHEYTPENSLINSKGFRECRTCLRERRRRRAAGQ